MHNTKQQNKVIALLIVLAMLFSLLPAADAAEPYDPNPPDAKLMLKGFTMQEGANGEVQAFLKVSISNINATGISVYLNYDSDVIVPSDSGNEEVSKFTDAWIYDTEAFPSGFSEHIGKDIFDDMMIANLIPNPETDISDDGANITTETWNGHEVKCFKAEDTTLDLGYISFLVKDPQQLIKRKSEGTLNTVLSLKDPDDGGISLKYIYFDTEINDYRENDIPGTLDYLLDVDVSVISAEAKHKEIDVSSYNVFYEGGGSGDINDLISYLNKYHKTIIVRYTDDSYVRENFEWDADKITVSPSYDPRGGTFTVTQPYSDDFDITIKVNMTPVYLLRFNADPLSKMIIYEPDGTPRENLYWPDDGEELPEDKISSEIPNEAEPVISEEFDTFVPPKISLAKASWSPNSLDSTEIYSDAAVATTEFEYNVTNETDTMNAPWLTIDESKLDRKITVTRQIGTTSQKTAAPDGITATVDDDGVMTITVTSLGGSGVTDGTSFRIYFPNGMVIDTADLSIAKVTDISGGTATIKINTNKENPEADTDPSKLSDDVLDAIQSIINMGSDSYSLTATETGKGESDPSPFECDGRGNYYLEATETYSDGTIITADYSGGKSGMFTVYPSQSLENISTYIEFPDGTQIPTAFNGLTGSEVYGAALNAAKVDSWSIEGSSDTTLPASGDVTIVGKLSEYSYTNFGDVKNPKNVYLRLKLTINDSGGEFDPEKEKIKLTTKISDTAEFEIQDTGSVYNFDTQQVGNYTEPQIAVFDVLNIGDTNIEGLSVSIDNTEFILSSPPDPTSLAKTSGTSSFAIRTVVGLPAGEYEATVTVSSNTNSQLKQYKVKFKVSPNPVYKIVIDTDPADNLWGTAYVEQDSSEVSSTTYAAGEEITLKAVPIDTDYRFKEWQTDQTVSQIGDTGTDGSVTAQFTLETEGKTITGNTITITAVFDGSIAAKLRFEDLKVYEGDGETEEILRDVTTQNATSFSFSQTDYLVIVPNETDENVIWFKPQNLEIDGGEIVPEITIKYEEDGTEKTKTITKDELIFDEDTGSYKTPPFTLAEGDNTVTINQSYTDGDGTVHERDNPYTIIIKRKQPVSVTKFYGNSPFGLIESDTSHTEENWKTEAKAYFHEHHTYGGFPTEDGAVNYVPEGAGNTAVTYYSEDAWSGGTNYDEDEYAIFVYEGDKFVDPGFSDLKNSLGVAVDQLSVRREITVYEMNSTVSSSAVNDLLDNVTQKTLVKYNGGQTCEMTELMSLRIRPGIYKLKYIFADSDGLEAEFSRPLIILPRKGDLNIDKSVTSADYNELYNRFTANSAGRTFLKDIIRANETWSNLYVYRTADVNEDRNANTADAHKAKADAADASVTGISEIQYYVKLPETIGEATAALVQATPKPVETSPPEKADLSLDFLGIGDDPASGPVEMNFTDENIGNLVWFGVSVQNVNNILPYFNTDGISSMDIAFDYDPGVFKPHDTYDSGTKADWIADIGYYNFDNGVDPDDPEYWDSQSISIDTSSTVWDYGAPPDNDTWREATAEPAYKTAYISLKPRAGGTANYRLKGVTEMSGRMYLIRVPFRLEKLPDATKDAMQLHLGPQTFIFGTGSTGAETYAAWEGPPDKNDVESVSDKTTPLVNLRNYFTWSGDYGEADTFLTNIQLFDSAKLAAWDESDPESDSGEITLYREHELLETQAGYQPKWKEYFAAVDNDVGQVTLRLTPGDKEVTVTYSLHTVNEPESVTDSETGEVITAPEKLEDETYMTVPSEVTTTYTDGSTYRDSSEIALTTIDGDLVESWETDGTTYYGGFTNVIKVTLASGDVYVLNIRRYEKPHIELAYGNSPAGLIWRDEYHNWTDEEKANIVKDFEGKKAKPLKQYPEGKIPVLKLDKNGDPVYAPHSRPYSSAAWEKQWFDAWEGSNVNYDCNPYSYFVYQMEQINDPGYRMINEYDLEEDKSGFTATVTVAYSTSAIPKYTGTDEACGVTRKEITLSSAGKFTLKNLVRPDLYFINYTYDYKRKDADPDADSETITATRPLGIINKVGDVSMSKSCVVNGSDSRDLSVYAGTFNKIKTTNTLFAFRVADIDITASNAISSADYRMLKTQTSALNSKSAEQYYPTIN